MESNDIDRALRSYFNNQYTYRLSNAYVFKYDWESDFFCINRTGYSFEVEIKVSRSDFKADFKKEKHRLFVEKPVNSLLPNKFYFAVPDGLVTIDEVPEYAGLITVKNGHILILKRAPFIHKNKYDFRRKLCDKFYNKYLSYRSDLFIERRNYQNCLKLYEDLKKQNNLIKQS